MQEKEKKLSLYLFLLWNHKKSDNNKNLTAVALINVPLIIQLQFKAIQVYSTSTFILQQFNSLDKVILIMNS